MQQVNFQDPSLNPLVTAVEEFAAEVRKWDGKEYIVLSPELKEEIEQAKADSSQADTISNLLIVATICSAVAFIVFSSPYLMYSSLLLTSLYGVTFFNFDSKDKIYENKIHDSSTTLHASSQLLKTKENNMEEPKRKAWGRTFDMMDQTIRSLSEAEQLLRPAPDDHEERLEEDVVQPGDVALATLKVATVRFRETSQEIAVSSQSFNSQELLQLMNARGKSIDDLPAKVNALNTKFYREWNYLNNHFELKEKRLILLTFTVGMTAVDSSQ